MRLMSSLPIIKEGSESPEMSELFDRMLEYEPPPHLTAETGEAVDEVIKYTKTTTEILRTRKEENKRRDIFRHPSTVGS